MTDLLQKEIYFYRPLCNILYDITNCGARLIGERDESESYLEESDAKLLSVHTSILEAAPASVLI